MSDENEVSAWIATEANLQELRARFLNCRIAEFTAGQARECGNIVARDPFEGDASHVVVCPIPGKAASRIKKDARRLASKARLLP
jgi:3-methyladenine DNA glycosylase/8-oxoguanine DNA glycosylase